MFAPMMLLVTMMVGGNAHPPSAESNGEGPADNGGDNPAPDDAVEDEDGGSRKRARTAPANFDKTRYLNEFDELHSKTQKKQSYKQYKMIIVDFMAWCVETRNFETGWEVTAGKAIEYMEKLFSPDPTRPEEECNPYNTTHEQVLKHRKAIVYLWSLQINDDGSPKTFHPFDRNLRWNALVDDWTWQRVRHRDGDVTKSPLENTFADGYKKEQVTDLVRLFLTCDDDDGKRLIPEREEQNLRDCLDFLFGDVTLCRGDERRRHLLECMLQIDVPVSDSSEHVTMPVVGVVLWRSKGNKKGDAQYAFASRHKEVQQCLVAMLALYFFSRFDVNGEVLPDFLGPKGNWYNKYYLLKGQTTGNPLKYESQRKAARFVFDKAGIFSSKATHAGRVCAADYLCQQDVNLDEAHQLGCWAQVTTMLRNYVTAMMRIPKTAIAAMAGFGNKPSQYRVPRSELEVPQELLDMVFGGTELERMLKEAMEKPQSEDEYDLSSVKFLSLLIFLRKVLLQDSVILRQEYPDLHLWKSPVFNCDAYREFEKTATEQLNLDKETIHYSAIVENVLPVFAKEMGENFVTMRGTIQSGTRQTIAAVDNRLDGLEKRFDTVVGILGKLQESVEMMHGLIEESNERSFRRGMEYERAKIMRGEMQGGGGPPQSHDCNSSGGSPYHPPARPAFDEATDTTMLRPVSMIVAGDCDDSARGGDCDRSHLRTDAYATPSISANEASSEAFVSTAPSLPGTSSPGGADGGGTVTTYVKVNLLTEKTQPSLTLGQVWIEYSTGINGIKPALRDLEKATNGGWRKDNNSIKSMWSYRNRFYDEVLFHVPPGTPEDQIEAACRTVAGRLDNIRTLKIASGNTMTCNSFIVNVINEMHRKKRHLDIEAILADDKKYCREQSDFYDRLPNIAFI